MKVLFYTVYEPSPISGGVEHATLRVAVGLSMKYGYKCYSIYKRPASNIAKAPFVEKAQLPTQNSEVFIKEFCDKNAIEIIVVQGRPAMISVFRQTNARILYVHHADPLFEIKKFNIEYLLYKVKNKKYESNKGLLLCIANLLLFPFYKKYIEYNHKQELETIYKESNRIALISESFIKDYNQLAKLQDTSKLTFINNPLSYEYFATADDIKKKKKQVLIVCRMEEFSKKVTKAFLIWENVVKDSRAKGWELIVVGDGEDFEIYKRSVKKRKIERIKFIGKTNPYNYYMDSAIFFMTSVSEAWGITLTEAMQLGCVSIAFDSYSSVRDIINSDETGVLIPYGNIREYSEAALRLMEDESLRCSMAIKSVESSRRFTLDNICKKWDKVIREI